MWATVGQMAGPIGTAVALACIQRMLPPPAGENPTMRRMREQLSHGEDGRGSRPRTILPITEEEFCAAKVRLQYREDHLHFAVSGMPGSGKSSLVNSFRGVKGTSPNAARVGVVETTTMIQRYPDPRQGTPYHRYVWYDVPGAGTLTIPSQQYFTTQGLFIFDFVILVYDVVSRLFPACNIWPWPDPRPALHRDRRRYPQELPQVRYPGVHCALEGQPTHQEHDGRRR